jgi:membrane protein YdbS with pleckstrin-like domain
MKCPSCQGENNDKATFCQQCGARLSDDAAQAAGAEADATFPVPRTKVESRDQRSKLAAAMGRGDDVSEEREVWDGSYSPKAMIGWWAAAGVITIAALVAGVMFLGPHMMWVILALVLGWLVLGGQYAYRRYGVHYFLTTQRFLHETGILWRRTDRIELIDIADVTFRQGPIERMFNVGTIRVTSSDRSHPEMELPGIDDVRKIADTIDDLRRRERRRRGLHVLEHTIEGN